MRSLAREFEADAGDALDLVGVVDLGIDCALLAVAEIGDGFRLAEIDPAGQLAHDHDVEAFDQFALEAGSIRPAPDSTTAGPQIGEQPEVLAQPQQPGFRPHLIGHAVPFRTADRAEDHRVGGLGLCHGRRR